MNTDLSDMTEADIQQEDPVPELIAKEHTDRLLDNRLGKQEKLLIFIGPILLSIAAWIILETILFGLVNTFSLINFLQFLMLFYLGLAVWGAAVTQKFILSLSTNASGDVDWALILISVLGNVIGIIVIAGPIAAIMISVLYVEPGFSINSITGAISWTIFVLLFVIPSVGVSFLIRYVYLPFAVEETDEWVSLIERYRTDKEQACQISQELDEKLSINEFDPVQFTSAERASDALDELEESLDRYDTAVEKYKRYQSELEERAEDILENFDHVEPTNLTVHDVFDYDTPESAIKAVETTEAWIHAYERYHKARERADVIFQNVEGIDPSRVKIQDISDYDSAEKLEEKVEHIEAWLDVYERYYETREGVQLIYTLENLSGIGSAKADALRDVGIENSSDIAKVSEEEIKNVKGIGEQQAQQIKKETGKSVSYSFKSIHSKIPDEQLLNSLVSCYGPPYESVEDAEENLDMLVSWLKIYDRYGELHRRAMNCQKEVTIEELDLPDIGATRVSDLQDIGIRAADDIIEANVEELSEAPGIGESLAHRIKDEIGESPPVITEKDHLNSLAKRYSPEYSSIEEAEELLDEFESWIDLYEQFREYYLFVMTQDPKYEAKINFGDDREIEIPHDRYHPSKFESVDEAQRAIRTLEMTLDIIEFLSDASPDHPSIEAESWRNAIATALEQQYPEALKPIQAQIRRMSNTLWEADDLFKYNWSEFEDLIGIIYQKQGYDVNITQDVADMGVDIWASKDNKRVAIQVKHFREGNTVGRETLQKIVSTLAKGDADKAVVITSSTFANTADQYASDFGPNLRLIGRDELIRQLSEFGVPPPN